MRFPKIRIKKSIFYAAAILITVLVVLVVIISPFAKYYIEKHDKELFGRESSIGWAYVNPITGFIYLHDLKIYELQGDSVFIAANGASANFSVVKLFSKQVVIQELVVDRPVVKLFQKKDALSIDDVVKLFSGGNSNDKGKKGSDAKGFDAWHVTLLKTKINEGEFRYFEKIIPIHYVLKNLNIAGPGKTADVDTLFAKFSFEDGRGRGKMNGDFTINLKNLDYRFDAEVHAFDLEIIRQYIWELINYGVFRSQLDASIRAKGNFKSVDSLTATGRIVLSDFHLGRTSKDSYVAFKKLGLAVRELSPGRNRFFFDTITLDSPFIKYEVFDSLDNVQALFGKAGKNISDVTSQAGRFNLVIEIARYLKQISRNFFMSDFQIGRLSVFNGHFAFNDYSTSEEFSMEASPVTLRADSVSKKKKRVNFSLQSAIKPYGRANFFISINPKDSGDFDLKYNIEKIPAAVFNPYLISVTSFPLDRGTLEVSGLWNVRNSIIKASNHVLVIDPRVTRRVRNKDNKWIPMPLIMSIARDRGNVIDYEIPITGNLRHPRFHLSDVVTDAIRNIFVKPVTTPYRMEVKEIENEIEKSLTVKWEMNQRQLKDHQLKFVKHIADFLKEHQDASITVQPFEYEGKEKEHILFYETKKKYFLISHNKKSPAYTKEDSLAVCLMSIRDHGLVKYISRNVSDTSMFSLQDKCFNFVGHPIVNESFQKLIVERKASFMSVFANTSTSIQVKMKSGESVIPYDGFSYFKFDYPNGADEKLRDAYERMKELNNDEPRKRYLKERRKAGGS